MKPKHETPEELRKKLFDGRQEEEEQLDLDELMNVEGGTEPDDPVRNCGLGCYLSGMSGIKSETDEKNTLS